MSSAIRIPRHRSLSRFRYVDYIIKSMPLISVAFILYVIFQGTFW